MSALTTNRPAHFPPPVQVTQLPVLSASHRMRKLLPSQSGLPVLRQSTLPGAETIRSARVGRPYSDQYASSTRPAK
jgi:hypothetical protein